MEIDLKLLYGGYVVENENGVLKINKYLALGISIFVLLGFVFAGFGGVALKNYQIEENRIAIQELRYKREEIEKSIIRYEERQKEIQAKLEKILNILEAK